jgi:DNA-binding response OmpR family regulator
MHATTRRVDDLVVVDPAPDDYSPLAGSGLSSHERTPPLTIRHFRTGEEALRAFDPTATTLWMANLKLPDMTGIALLELIRRRAHRYHIVLVGDVYSADDELAARAAGASAYLCKPVETSWLQLCRRAPPVRHVARKGASQTYP